MKVRVPLLILLASAATLVAEPSVSPEVIIENYCAASRGRQQVLNGSSAEVKIDARLPRLKKYGSLYALRHISKIGRITYDALRFEGDNTVKSNVIARYLTAEVQNDKGAALSVTPQNYKFKYRRTAQLNGRDTYVFEVNPRRKEVGLYKGELWIDAELYVCVRESGRFVKNPSIFLKRVEFVRDYGIRDGISVPLRVQSVAQTRLVGPAELMIDYGNYTLPENAKRASITEDNQ